ncbi:hypothetical protein K438DRAFT_1771847 [Mycena galopus ATCC 62051]|nr:hypothetical protein K438DRAFT_1771847 [Mycena galopus ATCC 62051]
MLVLARLVHDFFRENFLNPACGIPEGTSNPNANIDGRRAEREYGVAFETLKASSGENHTFYPEHQRALTENRKRKRLTNPQPENKVMLGLTSGQYSRCHAPARDGVIFDWLPDQEKPMARRVEIVRLVDGVARIAREKHQRRAWFRRACRRLEHVVEETDFCRRAAAPRPRGGIGGKIRLSIDGVKGQIHRGRAWMNGKCASVVPKTPWKRGVM